jgi:hypothetical protein
MASCGIIFGHAMFHGAEGPNSVCVSEFDSSLLLYTDTCDILGLLERPIPHIGFSTCNDVA